MIKEVQINKIYICLILFLFFFITVDSIQAKNLNTEDKTQIKEEIITELLQDDDFKVVIDNYLKTKELNIITSFEQASVRLDRYINTFTWIIGLMTILIVLLGFYSFIKFEKDWREFKKEKTEEIEKKINAKIDGIIKKSEAIPPPIL
ncbi:hypothetical protein KAT95_02445 [Candidatus Parcubacteria bacterium]|nr:hypothetical protein [Candidatus Parcubacteria bacterium]